MAHFKIVSNFNASIIGQSWPRRDRERATCSGVRPREGHSPPARLADLRGTAQPTNAERASAAGAIGGGRSLVGC